MIDNWLCCLGGQGLLSLCPSITSTLCQSRASVSSHICVRGQTGHSQLLEGFLFGLLISLIQNLSRLEVLIPCLNSLTEARSSRMFARFPPELFKALSEEPLTGHFHHYGVTEQVDDSSSAT